MSKKSIEVDVAGIASELQKFYDKDKKIKSIITTGDTVKSEYQDEDLCLLPNGHPLTILSGLRGIPWNKIIQVAGKPDTGKSTFGGEAVAEAQRNGVQVIYWDSEDKFDSHRLKQFGGDPGKILMIKSNEILKGGELVRRYINTLKAKYPDLKILLVWDSVGGSQSRSHAERELDNEKHAQPGQDAKENGSVMKTMVALINKYPDSIAVYMANQTYAKIGFMQKGDAAAGGTKIEYHSSLIIMLKRIKVLTKVVKGVMTKYGIITRATVTKNHLSQSSTSVHQLDFKITAEGAELTEGGSTSDEGEDDAE